MDSPVEQPLEQGLMKRLTEGASGIAEWLNAPLFTIAFRVLVLILAGVSVYAFKQYKHEAITGDATIKDLISDTASNKATIAGQQLLITAQQFKNQEFDSDFKQCQVGLSSIDEKLATILEHEKGTDQRLERIEHGLDRERTSSGR